MAMKPNGKALSTLLLAALLLTGCATGSSCRMSAKESSAFEELVFPSAGTMPGKYRVKGIYNSEFERSEIDLSPSEAPIVYCVRFERQCSLYMSHKFGSGFTMKDVRLEAVATYSEENGLNCPFGLLTIERIIEAESRGPGNR